MCSDSMIYARLDTTHTTAKRIVLPWELNHDIAADYSMLCLNANADETAGIVT